jgi:4-alpha-glucanotransferase
MNADAWGIAYGYNDGADVFQPAPPETHRAIRRSMGAAEDGSGAPVKTRAVVVVHPGMSYTVDAPAVLRLEDGTERTLAARTTLSSATLVHGYHELRREATGEATRVIMTPGACVLPQGLRSWGWAVQLYAARSRRSWGIGDFRDLRTLSDWSAARGSSMILVNPLHAPSPILSQQPSPYFPTSRVYRNPLYLDIAAMPGAKDLSDVIEPLAVKGRALNADRRIDRDAVFRLKYAALQLLWAQWRERRHEEPDTDAAFDAYREGEGRQLTDFSTFCALVEQHPSSWLDWPADLRRPDAPGIFAFRAAHAERIEFHAWVQWQVDHQLKTATGSLDLMTDLAIGVDRGGADGWMWQDSFALDMSVGAPPDAFNTLGQDWGLPPFDPWKLQQKAYEPFIRTVRAAFRHAGALRIDHVMGLFRLYWIPSGGSPAQGCYVYTPFRDLLGIVALESVRTGSYVVGEDLGTIEPYVREELTSAKILSYKLSQFEPGPSSKFPENALAAITTHDLPTIPGLLTGSDLEAQRAIGVEPNEDGVGEVRRSLAAKAGFPDVAEVGEPPAPGEPSNDALVLAMYAELATAPCMLLTATLDDALGVEERPNMPGTIDEWPNWRIALPVELDKALADPRVEAIAHTLNNR